MWKKFLREKKSGGTRTFWCCALWCRRCRYGTTDWPCWARGWRSPLRTSCHRGWRQKYPAAYVWRWLCWSRGYLSLYIDGFCNAFSKWKAQKMAEASNNFSLLNRKSWVGQFQNLLRASIIFEKKTIKNYVLFSATCRLKNEKISFFFRDRRNFDLNARKFRILSRRKNIRRQDNVF